MSIPSSRGLVEHDAHRAEAVAEQPDALANVVDDARAGAGQLRREREPRRHGLRPAAELLLGGQAVAGRVQLDGVEALGVVARGSRAAVPAG